MPPKFDGLSKHCCVNLAGRNWDVSSYIGSTIVASRDHSTFKGGLVKDLHSGFALYFLLFSTFVSYWQDWVSGYGNDSSV